MDPERWRLEEARGGQVAWRRCGPYLADRQKRSRGRVGPEAAREPRAGLVGPEPVEP